MEYNTSRKKMVLPEYGRNVQKMVDQVKAIKDRDERNHAAKIVINIMGNMFPHLRDISDFKHKLWDHIFIMADFDLDIDSPYPRPERTKLQERPDKLAYPNDKIRFKHYGQTLEDMIRKTIEFEDGPEKDHLYTVLANHMKKSYVSWNRDSVADETIFANINILSKGKLSAPEGLKLTDVKDIIGPKKKKKHPKKKQHSSY